MYDVYKFGESNMRVQSGKEKSTKGVCDRNMVPLEMLNQDG